MKHVRRLLPTGFIFVQALMLGVGAALHSPVIDEIAHLAAGVSNWELDRFDLFEVNPPVVRMVAALPVLAAGARSDYGSYSQGVGGRAEFAVMDDFVRANAERVIWLVTLARWGVFPIVLLGGYICYRWARELYGDAAGIMALVLWCFCPNVLAYGQVINADAGATALGLTAGYFFWKWLRDPAWDRAVVAGVVLGIAELSKTTWVVLFALWPALWLVWRLSPKSEVKSDCISEGRTRGPHPGPLPEEKGGAIAKCKLQNDASGQWTVDRGQLAAEHGTESGATRAHPNPLPKGEGTTKTQDLRPTTFAPNPKSKIENPKRHELAQLAIMLALGVFCINAGYDFDGSGTKLRNFLFVSRPLTGALDGPRGPHVGNRFAKSWLGKLPMPLPRNYVEGIDLQWHDIEMGKPSYLRGRWQHRGWWYWYLYALAVKVPLGTWGLFLLAVAVRVGHHRHHAPRGDLREATLRDRDDGFYHAERGIYGGHKRGDTRVTWKDELVLLAPAAVVLALVSSQTGFSRYIRYVLPMFPFVFVWISGVATVGTHNRRGRAVAVLAAILLAWSVGSSLWYAPHWMSYFNELAGGPLGGPAHLIDAQVDWGQDLLYLKKWHDAHPDARPPGLVYFGPINPAVAGVDFVLPPKGIVDDEWRADSGSERPHPGPLPKEKGAAPIAGVPRHLKPGWYAISVNFLYGYPHYIYAADGSREWVTRPYYSYFRRFQPVATAGYSIYIYQLTTEDISAGMHGR